MKHLHTTFEVRVLMLSVLLAFVSLFDTSQCMAQKQDTYIRELCISATRILNGNVRNLSGYTIIDQDLNEKCGVGSPYIHVGYKTTTNPAEAITGIIISHDRRINSFYYNNCFYRRIRYTADYNGFNGDTNDGATGEYIYIYYTTDRPEENGLLKSLNFVQEINASKEYAPLINDNLSSLEPNANLNEGTKGVNIYAEVSYNRETYRKITFSANGGYGAMNSYIFLGNGTLPANTFARDNYYFDSWNTKNDGSGKSFSDLASVKATDFDDTQSILYAIWKPIVAKNVTENRFYDNAQDAIYKAYTANEIMLFQDIDYDLTIYFPMSLNMNNKKVTNITITNTAGVAKVYNGTVTGDIGFSANNDEADGDVTLENLTVKGNVYADHHPYTINGGEYANIICNNKDGKVDILGDNTYVKNLNATESITYPGINIHNGYYACDLNKAKNIVLPEEHRGATLPEAPEGAPDASYIYTLEPALSFIKTKDTNNSLSNYIATESTTFKDTKVQMHFKFNKLNKGTNAIFGTAASNGLDGNDAFAVWVDGSDKSFCFATGCKMLKSPAGLAKTNQDYYITLQTGHIVIDTIPDSKEADHIYHHDFAVYPFHSNTGKMEFGKIAGVYGCICDMSIYSAKLWENDELKYDLIPIFSKTSAKKGMEASEFARVYDLVNEKEYYAKGTNNELFLGTAKSCGGDDNHYGFYLNDEGNRQCIICGKEYKINAEEEPYIDFNGTSYFDTGYVPNDKTEIRMHFIYQPRTDNLTHTLFGTSKPKSQFGLGCGSYMYAWYPKDEDPVTSTVVSNQDFTANQEYYVKMDMKSLKVSRRPDFSNNMVEAEFPSSTYVQDKDLTLCVGGLHYSATNYGVYHPAYYLFSYEIYEEGKLLHKFVPSSKHGRYGFLDIIDGTYRSMLGSEAKAPFEAEDHDNYIKNKQQFYYNSLTSVDNNTKINVRFRIDNYNTSGTNITANHVFGCYKQNTKQFTGSIVDSGNNTYKFKLICRNNNNTGNTEYIPNCLLSLGEIYNITTFRDNSKVYINIYDADNNLICPFEDAIKDNGWDVGDDNPLYILNDCKQDNNWQGDMSLFQFDIYKNDILTKRFVPTFDTYLGYGFKTPNLFDTVNYSVYNPIWRSTYNWEDDMLHITTCEEHKYTEQKSINSDGTRTFKCQICGKDYTNEKNYLNLTGTSRFNTEVIPTFKTQVSMGFNTDNFEKSSNNVALFGQLNDNKTKDLKDSYFFEILKESFRFGWYGKIDSYFVHLHKDEFINFTKNNVYVYDEYDKKTPVFHATRSDVTSYQGKTPLYFPSYPGVSTEQTDIQFYYMNIDEGTTHLRKYIPAIRDSKYGVLDLVSQKFMLPETEIKGYVGKCEEHKYCDIVEKDGEWYKRCNVCDEYIPLTKEEMIENFIRTNGSSCFMSSDNLVSLGTIDYETNTDIRNTQSYNDDGKLLHSYLPSRFGGNIGMFDTVNETFETMTGQGMSCYIPECAYHKFYKIEETNGKKYKHCYICDAKEPLNILTVTSEKDLRKVQPENNTHIIYMDMTQSGKHIQHIDSIYPAVNSSTSIFEYATMQEGALKHFFLPGIFNGNPGVYDAVADKFIEIEKAKVQIVACDHKYHTTTLSDGKVNEHCYICDNKKVAGYYMDVQYDGNGNTRGKMGVQRIVIADTLKLNCFHKDLGVFEGWKMKLANGKFSELILDGDSIQATAERTGTVTLVAQWTDAFTYNGDTLRINDDNTAEINIVDDEVNGFGTAKSFTGKSYSYQRTLKSDTMYGTLCLPFAINANEHPDCDLYIAKDVTVVPNENSYINLEKVETVDAGVPCIFKMKDTGADELVIKHTGTEAVAADAGKNVAAALTLNGVYDVTHIDIKDMGNTTLYAIQDDKFYRVATTLTIRPYRAYITSNSSAETPERYFLNFDDDATSIITIEDGNVIDLDGASYYTVGGIKLNAPQKGINIVKMKNGEMRKMRF